MPRGVNRREMERGPIIITVASARSGAGQVCPQQIGENGDEKRIIERAELSMKSNRTQRLLIFASALGRHADFGIATEVLRLAIQQENAPTLTLSQREREQLIGPESSPGLLVGPPLPLARKTGSP